MYRFQIEEMGLGVDASTQLQKFSVSAHVLGEVEPKCENHNKVATLEGYYYLPYFAGNMPDFEELQDLFDEDEATYALIGCVDPESTDSAAPSFTERLQNPYGTAMLITRLAAEPGWRGTGAGSALLTYTLMRCRNGASWAALTPSPLNEGPISTTKRKNGIQKLSAFYRQHGFFDVPGQTSMACCLTWIASKMLDRIQAESQTTPRL